MHGVDLASYMGSGAERVARTLGKLGLHPLRMDIAFCELPLLHVPGLLVAPDASDAERRLLQEALIAQVRAELDVDLLVVRVLTGTPEADAHGLPRVPFFENHVVATPSDHAAWLASVTCRDLRRSLRRGAEANAVVRYYDDALPPADVLVGLLDHTRARYVDEVAHPIATDARLFDAIAALHASLRTICTVELDGDPIAFSLILNAGPAALIRTTGTDLARGRRVHAYFLLQHAWIELAGRWRCAEADLGPTTPKLKARLGALPRATAYLVDFRRWWLRPARWLVERRLQS
ncbi:MAG: GNAT family N-acetyltransferase [Proteobacteria bacterium]|nr:GNAT family N-acetyltransferase [Pseudomonadota bacterium]